MELVFAILGGSAVAALITQVGETIRQNLRHKDDVENVENEDMLALKNALKWVMFDRIRYLGQKYIEDEEIDFDDRRILNEMHKCYHYGLNGNGDLDILMKDVNELPLK